MCNDNFVYINSVPLCQSHSMKTVTDELNFTVTAFVEDIDIFKTLYHHLMSMTEINSTSALMLINDLLDIIQIQFEHISELSKIAIAIHNKFRHNFMRLRAQHQMKSGMPRQFRTSTKQFKIAKNILALAEAEQTNISICLENLMTHCRNAFQHS